MMVRLTAEQQTKALILHRAYIRRAGLVIDALTKPEAFLRDTDELENMIGALNGPGANAVAFDDVQKHEAALAERKEVIRELGLRE